MIILATLLALAITAIYYKKTVPELQPKNRWILAGLRFIALTVVLILLLNPILHFKNSRLEKPAILILTDNSLSMTQVGEEGSKAKLMETIAEEFKSNDIAKDFEVIEHSFAAGLEGADSNTLLSPTLDELLKQYSAKNLKAIMLLSDGWFKDDDLEIIASLNIPIYSLLPQFTQTDFDISFNKLHLNKETFQDEMTPIICDLNALNYAGKARVNLLINDIKSSSEVIDFSKSSFQQIVLEHSFSKTGLNIVEVVIAALDSTETLTEINLDNNRVQSAIQVKNSKANVVLLSDQFNWDLRFIKDVIRKDEKFDLDILIKKDKLWEGRDEAKLSPFFTETKVLIIQNHNKLSLTAEDVQLIKQFHNNGGGILFMGEIVPELAELYPATSLNLPSTQKNNFQLTDISKQFQTFNFEDSNELNNIPPVDFFYVNPKLGSDVVAVFNNAERSPAILVNQSTAGTVLYMPLAGLYRWQMWDKDGTYQNFISNLISWISLNNENKTFSYTDKISYAQSDAVKIFLQTFDEKLEFVPNLTAEASFMDSTGKVIDKKLMISGSEDYRCEFSDLTPGSYKYEIRIEATGEKSSGSIFVTSSSPEAYDRGFNYPLLSYLCAQTDGLLADDLNQLRSAFSNPESKEIITTTEIPLYRKWYLIALFLLTFCLELYLRKRWGLL